MKTKYFFGIAALVAFMASCEPGEIDSTDFDPDNNDTTQIGGISFKMSSNGQTWTYNSTGIGMACQFPGLPMNFWGVVTGDSVYYDFMNDSVIAGVQDTVFYLGWLSTIDTVGTYSLSDTAVLAVDCWMESQTFVKDYDASQVLVSISQLTNDSIYGSYSGPIEEVIWQNSNPVNTGIFDTVNAAFVVYRVPC